ncbi:MAG: hypothetical protein AB7V04_07830 [Desulfomonilaceae bacterium]
MIRVLRSLGFSLVLVGSVLFLSSVGYSQGISFPGGSVTWGNYGGAVTYPGGSVNWGSYRGGQNVPGGVDVNRTRQGRGNVNVSIPGFGFNTNIRW